MGRGIVQGLPTDAIRNRDFQRLMAMVTAESRVPASVGPGSCDSCGDRGWGQNSNASLEHPRRIPLVARGVGRWADFLLRSKDWKGFWVVWSQRRLENPRLAKKGAIPVFDNQQDCGGAQGALRHGAVEHPLTEIFLEAGPKDSGRRGS